MSQKSIGNTSDALITGGCGFFHGIIVHTDGTNAATVKVYDNTAATGSKLVSYLVVPTSATNRIFALSFSTREECTYDNGIYVDITCAGDCTFDVYYSPDLTAALM